MGVCVQTMLTFAVMCLLTVLRDENGKYLVQFG